MQPRGVGALESGALGYGASGIRGSGSRASQSRSSGSEAPGIGTSEVKPHVYLSPWQFHRKFGD